MGSSAHRTRSAPSRSGVVVGYFANGFVFSAEPDFAGVSAAIPDRLIRGYKHNRQPVWLLDLWKLRGKLSLPRAPFCDPAADGFRTDLAAVDTTTRDFLATFQGLKEAVGHRTADPEQGNVHLALAVAAAARRPTFFFAADDEETDMGCRAVPGSLVSFGCRLDRLAVQYSAARITATPLNFQEDDDEDGLRIPQTDIIWFLDYLPGLTGAEREALLDALAGWGATAFFPRPRETPTVAPALAELREARNRPGSKGGTRYTDVKMLGMDPSLREPGGYHQSWRERFTALQFQPRPDLLPALSHLKAAKAPLLRKLVDTALTESLALRKEKLAGGVGKYVGRFTDGELTVRVDFGSMLGQLCYTVSLKYAGAQPR